MKNIALITGASSGIGKELAKIHARNGGDLIIIARNESRLEELKNELEEKHQVVVKTMVKDLSVPEATKEVYETVSGWNVQVDYLINNAGFGGRGKFHERAWSEDEAMINLNILALTALTRLFLPDMVKRNSGKILNVGSTASFMPGPLQAVYFATKSYVSFFSNAIAEELSNTQVTVTVLLPGATDTEFAKVSGMEETSLFEKTVSAVQVAQDGYDGMMKGKLDVISGLAFSQKLMTGIIPFIPKKVLMKQVKKMQEL